MKRILISIFTLAILSCIGIAPEASAARQTKFVHMGRSERASILVFHDWKCKDGRASDFVRRGHEAELSVGSVWIPKGYSLWTFDRTGTFGILHASKRSKSRCYSFLTQPGRSFYAALVKGNTWE